MILEHVARAQVITFLGLCKNAGKTTALATLMQELSGEIVAVTTIGRDGESTDLVTGTEKPSLYVPEGTLFATARGTLSLCDGNYGVEQVTDIATPLGKVAVLRALSACFVQLAGPSGVEQLEEVAEEFSALGAQRILIDGAASRKSLAKVGGGQILCTGASLANSMDEVVAATAHVCNLFSTPSIANVDILCKLEDLKAPYAVFTMEGEELPMVTEGEILWNQLPNIPLILWIEGGVTDGLVARLTRRGAPTLIMTPDPTHLLVERLVWERFAAVGGRAQVVTPLPISLVCANPWSAYGGHFHGDLFLQKLQGAVDCPVINVKERGNP